MNDALKTSWRDSQHTHIHQPSQIQCVQFRSLFIAFFVRARMHTTYNKGAEQSFSPQHASLKLCEKEISLMCHQRESESEKRVAFLFVS